MDAPSPTPMPSSSSPSPSSEGKPLPSTITVPSSSSQSSLDDNEKEKQPDNDDPLYERLLREARETLANEPELCALLHKTVLAENVYSFETAIATTVSYRLLPQHEKSDFCPHAMNKILTKALYNNNYKDGYFGHTMSEAVRADVLAVLDRDPACHTILEVILFYKGFSALVAYRAGKQKWTTLNKTKSSSSSSMTALFLQSQASAQFGLDIHPGAKIGAGIMFDHGTGIVVGETAHIGDGCTLLHGVTLGGTGKDSGDRHPKVGSNVLIGANASILGNIHIGNSSKIGAGSIVLRSVPPGATAVGAPAKIIGRVKTNISNPASTMDQTNQHDVELLHKSHSLQTLPTIAATTTTTTATPSLAAKASDSSISSSSLTENSDNDDDNDEGNPVRNKSDFVGICPYRAYRDLAVSAPKDSMTICTLFKLLTPVGIPKDVIGCTFFELDTRNVGYVYCTKDNFNRLLMILKKEMSELQQQQQQQQQEQQSKQQQQQQDPTTTTTYFDEEKVMKILEHYCIKHHHQTTT